MLSLDNLNFIYLKITEQFYLFRQKKNFNIYLPGGNLGNRVTDTHRYIPWFKESGKLLLSIWYQYGIMHTKYDSEWSSIYAFISKF